MDTHVDYPKESVDSVIDLLISLSPKQIIVYDPNGKALSFCIRFTAYLKAE